MAQEQMDTPFSIPKKWRWVTLNSVGEIIGGGTPKSTIPEYWVDGDIQWFTPVDLGQASDKYIKDSSRKITNLGLIRSSAKLMPSGSILFSSRAPIGYIAISKSKCCTNQGCKSFIPNNIFISSEWAYYAIKSRTVDIISRASGTTFKEISGKGLGETLIPLPPLEEQYRITSKLEYLYKEIAAAENAYLELKSDYVHHLKSILLSKAIRGNLVPQLESEPSVDYKEISPEQMPFDIPNKWKWVQLKTISSSNIGLTYKPQDVSTAGIPILRSCNIENGKIVFTNLKRVSKQDIPAKCLIQKGDILMCSRNGSKSLVGKCALMPKTGEVCCFGAFMTVIRSPYNCYLKFYFESDFFRKTMLEVNNTTSINQITQKKLLDAYVPLPPIEEQHRIVDALETALSLINKIIYQ